MAGVLPTILTAVHILELQLRRVDGMPCGDAWRLARADLGRRGPLWIGAFVVLRFTPARSGQP